jgi:hypothetical protein
MKPADTDTLTAPIETDTQTESLFEGYEPQAQTVVVEESVDIDEPMDERVEPVWDEQSIDDHEADHDEDMRILGDGPVSRPIAEPEESGIFGTALGRIFGRFGKKSADTNPQPEPVEAASDSIEISDDVSEPTREAEPTDSMDDLVVVSIQSARTPRFEGINLHKACLRAGLRRTESQMYQRFPLDESEHPLFSLVNGVEPGTFEEDAKSIDTPVVFLFTELPKQADPVFAVNELISGARSIARDIGGDVFDQQGTPISKEWIDLARAQAGHQTLLRS